MVYDVKQRLKYIGPRQDQVRGEFIVYSRGAVSVPIKLVCGHTDVQDLVPQNTVTQARYVDFILTAASLILPGIGLTLPERGDTILYNGDLYTITPPMASEDVYNFTTMYKDRIRVHTLTTTLAV